jgi:VanZ family protein
MAHVIARWIPAFLVASSIVFLSSLTPAELPGPDLALGWDKVAHATAYAILAASARFATPRSWLIFVAVTIFGCCDELHQGLTPGRDPSVWDLVADVAGAAAALLAWRALSLPERPASRVT